MAVPVRCLVITLLGPPIVILAALEVIEERLFQMGSDGERVPAGFGWELLKPLSRVGERLGNLRHRLLVVADFLGVERVIADGRVHMQGHRTTLARLVVIDVGGALFGADGAEVRWTMERGLGLDDGSMRAAHHAHLAVRPGLRSNPFNRVEPVVTLQGLQVW